jgi:hypothetical protein
MSNKNRREDRERKTNDILIILIIPDFVDQA